LLKEGWKNVNKDRSGGPTDVKSHEVIKSVNDLIQYNKRVIVDNIK